MWFPWFLPGCEILFLTCRYYCTETDAKKQSAEMFACEVIWWMWTSYWQAVDPSTWIHQLVRTWWLLSVHVWQAIHNYIENINQLQDCHIIYLSTLTHHVQVSCLQTKDINLTHQEVFLLTYHRRLISSCHSHAC